MAVGVAVGRLAFSCGTSSECWRSGMAFIERGLPCAAGRNRGAAPGMPRARSHQCRMTFVNVRSVRSACEPQERYPPTGASQPTHRQGSSVRERSPAYTEAGPFAHRKRQSWALVTWKRIEGEGGVSGSAVLIHLKGGDHRKVVNGEGNTHVAQYTRVSRQHRYLRYPPTRRPASTQGALCYLIVRVERLGATRTAGQRCISVKLVGIFTT
jgi:hypothetical protein